MQTATEFIKEELNKLGLLDKGQVMTNIFEQAKQIEYNQRGYTKKDVLKAGEIGEINHHDYNHIVKLLDEARAINETYGSKGSDEHIVDTNEMIKDINYWKQNCEEEIMTTPISVLRYISELEKLTTSSQTEISDEEIEKIEYSTSKFMNWFIRHYSTSNEGGTLGYVDSMGKPISSEKIIEHYKSRQ